MENPKPPETLEDETPDANNPKAVYGSTGLLGFGGNVTGLVSGLGPQVSGRGNGAEIETAEVENVGPVEVEFGLLVNADAKAQNGYLKTVDGPEDCAKEGAAGVVVDCSSVGFGGNMSVDIARKIEEVKEDNTSRLAGFDLTKRIDISGDNISIYVDLSDSVTAVNPNNLQEGNGHGLLLRNEGPVGGVGQMIDRVDYVFRVGDVVWAKTKSKTWWPGKIFDPSEAPKFGLESDQTGRLLVEYYGYGHVSWCHPCQLKPFHVNFEQMLGENKARSFLAAVDKANTDFGNILNLDMTCSCLMNANEPADINFETNLSALTLQHEFHNFGEFSFPLFEPARLLSELKGLARIVRKIGILELTVAKSRLAAFYSSVGHHQLPMHQLWEVTEVEENSGGSLVAEKSKTFGCREKNKLAHQSQSIGSKKRKRTPQLINGGTQSEGLDGSLDALVKKEEINLSHSSTTIIENKNTWCDNKIGSSFEMRERKRSKYLSFPYVNLEQKSLLDENEDSQFNGVSHKGVNMAVACQFIGYPTTVKTSAKRFQKNWLNKFLDGSGTSAYPDLINSSCAEILSELHFAAVDCMHPVESKAFDSAEWFFTRFRISVYRDECVYEKYCRNMESLAKFTSTDLSLLQNDTNDVSSTSLSEPQVKKLAPCDIIKKQRKRSNTNSAKKIKSLAGLSDVNVNIDTSNLSVGCTPAVALHPVVGNATSAGPGFQRAAGIPDLNGNRIPPVSLLENSKDMGDFVSVLKKRKRESSGSEHSEVSAAVVLPDGCGKHASFASVSLDPPVTGPSVTTISNQCNGEGGSVCLPDSGGSYASKGMGISLFTADCMPGKKRRIRKQKESLGYLNTMPMDGLPDLNGTSAEPGLVGKDIQNGDGQLSKDKPEKKRKRRTKAEMLAANGGSLGAILILTFAQGVSMPSKEILISSFSRFGSLKESETQLLKDSCTAHVVFTRSGDAAEAIHSIERSNPFGATLTNYRLEQCSSLGSPPPVKAFRYPSKLPGSMQQTKSPPVNVIRQNLEIMTSMLENSGDTLSPDTKAKLENEIKGLLKKVSSMPSSSSG